MSIAGLKSKTKIEPMEAALANAEKSHHLENLFRKWREIEIALDAHAVEETDSIHSQAECNRLIEAPSTLMNSAAMTTSTTFRDLLFKPALWRWDAPELDDQPQRSDAIALSVFRGLVYLTGETGALTEIDKRTHIPQDVQSAQH